MSNPFLNHAQVTVTLRHTSDTDRMRCFGWTKAEECHNFGAFAISGNGNVVYRRCADHLAEGILTAAEDWMNVQPKNAG